MPISIVLNVLKKCAQSAHLVLKSCAQMKKKIEKKIKFEYFFLNFYVPKIAIFFIVNVRSRDCCLVTPA